MQAGAGVEFFLLFFFKEYCFRVRVRVRVRVDTNMVTTQHHGHNNDRSTRACNSARKMYIL